MSNKGGIIIADTVIDFSASTGSVYKLDAPRAGKLLIDQCWITFEEAVGDATTQGVASIEVGGTEVATYDTLGTEAIDDSAEFTPDGTVATTANPMAPIASGDVIDVKLKTQASGGTTTGTGRVHLVIEWGD